MKLATAAEMRELDRLAIKDYGIPGMVLMENAGRGVVSELEKKWGPVKGRRYLIFCGKGNNGGDGLVIARYLHNMGAKVSVRLFSDDMKGDAGTNLKAALKMGVDIKPVSKNLKGETSGAKHADAVIDAIFGTGLTDEVLKPYKTVMDMVNASAKRVVAVDIPSGVNSDSGRIMGASIRADLTVTFGLPKRGLYLYPGAQMTGEISVVDISIPAEAVYSAPIRANLITGHSLRGVIPPRKLDSNKGTFGHLFILAGSVGKTGAAVMAAQAASRSGAGLITVGVPESLNDVFEEKLTEEMTVPLPESGNRTLSLKALEKILEHLNGKTALAIGPGISTDPDTIKLISALLPKVKIPTLIDADGLNILSIDDEPLRKMKAPVMLTPHPGEMGRLLGVLAREVQADRPAAAIELAGEYNATVVLKGARTLVASPSGEFHINTTGNPGMATGGTGDVLTGVIGSLMAQGIPMVDAAKAGVYVHGLAGDLAACVKGQAGMVAGDITDFLPAGFMALNACMEDLQ
jgi:NAD(P)H-hydrate epimerase